MKILALRFTKLFFGLVLLFSTFFIGLAGEMLWSEISPPILTPCEVARNPKMYQEKIIRLKASVQTHYGYFFFRDESCNFGSLDAVINLPEDYQPESEQVQNFIGANNEKYLSAQTVITGKIDTTQKYQDYSPKFVISATKVELESKVTVEAEDK